MQRPDEASDGYLARADILWSRPLSRKMTISDLQAYIVLRGSLLSSEKKKKVILDSEQSVRWRWQKSMKPSGFLEPRFSKTWQERRFPDLRSTTRRRWWLKLKLQLKVRPPWMLRPQRISLNRSSLGPWSMMEILMLCWSLTLKQRPWTQYKKTVSLQLLLVHISRHDTSLLRSSGTEDSFRHVLTTRAKDSVSNRLERGKPVSQGQEIGSLCRIGSWIVTAGFVEPVERPSTRE